MTLCAVWQHLTDEDRTIAMSRLATLIAPEGILIVSLRHGPGAIERRVFPVSPDMTVEVAKACDLRQIGRASCRERVCQYVEIWVVAVALKKTAKKAASVTERMYRVQPAKSY